MEENERKKVLLKSESRFVSGIFSRIYPNRIIFINIFNKIYLNHTVLHLSKFDCYNALCLKVFLGLTHNNPCALCNKLTGVKSTY